MTFRIAAVLLLLLISVGGCSGSTAPATAPTGSAAATSPASTPVAASLPPVATAVPTLAPSIPIALPSGITDALFATHSDPSLESLLPRQVAGLQMLTYSLTLEELIAAGTSDPSTVEPFLANLGKTVADASFAAAFDPNGTLPGGIQAFKIAGADTRKLMEGFVGLARQDVGIDATIVGGTVGGKSVTIVSAGDGPNDTQWLYGRGDVVFTVVAPDETAAAQYLAALP